MRFISYLLEGKATYGAVVGEGVVPCSPLIARAPTLRAVLELGLLNELVEAVTNQSPEVPLSSVEMLPPVVDSRKILCVGSNYADHRDEAGHSANKYKYPPIFTRYSDTHVGHDHLVMRPSETRRLDYEGELAVIIGRPTYRVSETEALSSIAGYSCYNDFSVRNWQGHSSQWIPGKNFMGVGAFGPWLTTADEVGDVAQLTLETRVNGELRQSASIEDMVFSIPTIIAYISTFTPLSAGDVIVTGTPGGVGLFMSPPCFLEAGDLVEVEISGIGVLRNTVAVRGS